MSRFRLPNRVQILALGLIACQLVVVTAIVRAQPGSGPPPGAPDGPFGSQFAEQLATKLGLPTESVEAAIARTVEDLGLTLPTSRDGDGFRPGGPGGDRPWGPGNSPGPAGAPGLAPPPGLPGQGGFPGGSPPGLPGGGPPAFPGRPGGAPGGDGSAPALPGQPRGPFAQPELVEALAANLSLPVDTVQTALDAVFEEMRPRPRRAGSSI